MKLYMHDSIKMLMQTVEGLEEINDEVVFVGGAVVGLYGTDLNSPEISVTRDVDCVIEVTSYAKYANLEKRLLKKEFTNDTQAKVLRDAGSFTRE